MDDNTTTPLGADLEPCPEYKGSGLPWQGVPQSGIGP